MKNNKLESKVLDCPLIRKGNQTCKIYNGICLYYKKGQVKPYCFLYNLNKMSKGLF